MKSTERVEASKVRSFKRLFLFLIRKLISLAKCSVSVYFLPASVDLWLFFQLLCRLSSLFLHFIGRNEAESEDPEMEGRSIFAVGAICKDVREL